MAKAPKATMPLEAIDDEGVLQQFDTEEALREHQANQWLDKPVVFKHPKFGWSLGLSIEVEYVGREQRHDIPNFRIVAKSMKSDATVEIGLVENEAIFFYDAERAENYRKVRNG